VQFSEHSTILGYDLTVNCAGASDRQFWVIKGEQEFILDDFRRDISFLYLCLVAKREELA
jgi:hypothetical protein